MNAAYLITAMQRTASVSLASTNDTKNKKATKKQAVTEQRQEVKANHTRQLNESEEHRQRPHSTYRSNSQLVSARIKTLSGATQNKTCWRDKVKILLPQSKFSSQKYFLPLF